MNLLVNRCIAQEVQVEIKQLDSGVEDLNVQEAAAGVDHRPDDDVEVGVVGDEGVVDLRKPVHAVYDNELLILEEEPQDHNEVV